MPINSSIVDPVGDTNTGASGTIYDITAVSTSRTGPAGGTYTTISMTITTVPNILLPAAGALPDATQFAFIIAFDTDNNFADGTNYALCGTGGGGTYNGADFIIDGNGASGNRLADGNYAIKNQPAGTQVGEATVATSTNTITFTIPISAIGNNPAGPFNYGVIDGNGPAPQDCAANSGYTSAHADFLAQPKVVTGPPKGYTFTTWSH